MYGVFKCTSAGIYFFTFTCMSPEGKDLRVSLRTNRIPVVTIYSGAANSYTSASGSAAMTLALDDIVYLYIEKGDIYESNQMNRAFTTFSGFQLSETKSSGFFSALMGRSGNVNQTIGATDGKIIAAQEEGDKIFQFLKNQLPN